MQEDKVWTLIANKLTSNATAADLAELNNCLIKDPDMCYRVEILSAIWQPVRSSTEKETAAAFDNLVKKIGLL
ncbi:MAG: hypothetical protein ABIR15_11370 [Chitinophagaceae bacterium]